MEKLSELKKLKIFPPSFWVLVSITLDVGILVLY
tara:strand:+ start:3862 stop:3963 length:102 start_codon:yes stop_codon:yes gene_type:complete